MSYGVAGQATGKWRNGRRARFRSVCPKGRGGSTPPFPTSAAEAPRNPAGPRRITGLTSTGVPLAAVLHTAAQPSHDWAVRDPFTDFDVNAGGTLNVLQNVREHCPEAPVIHCSTNKVYGDRPNSLPYRELETRWEIDPAHPYADGIAEDMSIDACLHSVFGASKVAADVMVQEYGRYFDMRTACFRG